MKKSDLKTIQDELKMWQEALEDERSRKTNKVEFCKGAVAALRGLLVELGVAE